MTTIGRFFDSSGGLLSVTSPAFVALVELVLRYGLLITVGSFLDGVISGTFLVVATSSTFVALVVELNLRYGLAITVGSFFEGVTSGTFLAVVTSSTLVALVVELILRYGLTKSIGLFFNGVTSVTFFLARGALIESASKEGACFRFPVDFAVALAALAVLHT